MRERDVDLSDSQVQRLIDGNLRGQHGSIIPTMRYPAHQHLHGGRQGFSFYYDPNPLKAVIYDFARKRNNNNQYEWAMGGLSAGPSSWRP